MRAIGLDRLHWAGSPEPLDTIGGSDGADTLVGTAYNDTIIGLDGNDLIRGRDGDDALEGGKGNDTLNGGAGSDGLIAGGGHNLLDGGAGADALSGDAGDTLLGGADDDRVFVATGGHGGIAQGGAGHDTVVVTFAAGAAFSGVVGDLTGQDVSFEGATFDGFERAFVRFETGDNFATLDPDAKHVEIDGGAGDDHLVGNQHDNTLWSGAGSDTLEGRGGNDTLFEDSGSDDQFTHDLLDGGAGDDKIGAAWVDTTLKGGGGADTLEGGGRQEGGGGDDLLVSDFSANTMIGGQGADTYRFDYVGESPPGQPDTIIDSTIKAIDLRPIDADGAAGSNDAFTLVDAFTGHAGELTLNYDATDGMTHVQGDVDGDAKADLVILVTGDNTDPSEYVL